MTFSKKFLTFLEELEDAKQALNNRGKEEAFYRGLSNKEYELKPSLLRIPEGKDFTIQDKEVNFYCESFIRRNLIFQESLSSWEALAFFQHYGVPTRLLDWTESFAAALFFATEIIKTKTPQICILNPFELNKDVTKNNKIFTVGIDDVDDYAEHFIKIEDEHTWRYDKPIFLEIPWTNERIKAQRGYFTFHPNEISLEKSCPNCVRRIDIPYDEETSDDIKKFLELSGINEYTIYPDLEGLGKFLKRRYNF